MQQRILGPEGPSVGAVGLGNHPLSSFENRPSLADGAQVLVRAAEVGMTFWDTADAYCLDDTEVGYGERLAAAALALLPADLRDRIVVGTKGGSVRPRGAWNQDGRPSHLREAIDASLRALDTDCISLYQLHAPDTKVPFADSVGAIAEGRTAGKLRFVGLSNVSASQIDEAMRIVPISSVQNSYSLGDRSPEKDGVLEKCREHGIAFLPYSPFGGPGSAKSLGANPVVAEIAREAGVSPQRVVLAWMLQKYDRLIAIPGVSKVSSALDSAGADTLNLNESQIARLDASGV